MSYRAIGRSENPGVPILFGGYNLLSLVEIGLTDLPKSRVAKAPPAPPVTTPLLSHDRLELSFVEKSHFWQGFKFEKEKKKFRQTVTVTLNFVTLRRGLQSKTKNPYRCHIKLTFCFTCYSF